MGILHVQIDDELDKEFRIEIIKKSGSSKGSIREAVEEAIRLWLKAQGV